MMIILMILFLTVLVMQTFINNTEYCSKQGNLKKRITNKYLFDDREMLQHYMNYQQERYKSQYIKDKPPMKKTKRHGPSRENFNKDNLHLTVIKGGKNIKNS